jgi:hypothetical protein
MRALIKLLRILQTPSAWIFWRIERLIAKIDTEIERRRS